MKKIFWTFIVVLLLIFLFRSYVRLFDKPLGREIGSRFGISCPVCITGDVASDLTDQFDAIQTQLQVINQKLEHPTQSVVEETSFQTTTTTKVALYYFNQNEDSELPAEQQVNINSILPVYRMFPASTNLLVDVINELLKGNLTETEKKTGFVTEFPHVDFKLISARLETDGTLVLAFTEVPGFTSGGSARMLILSNVIEKTVLQFPGVKRVVFIPETLFQP